MPHDEDSISLKSSSARLAKAAMVITVILWLLLMLERFGWAVVPAATRGIQPALLLRRIAFQLVAALPEAMYLLSLWWIRQALVAIGKGDFYAPVISKMLNRVGAMLAGGAFLNVFVVPTVHRILGFGPGYWIAFDVTGLVLGAIGLSLAIVARVLDRARALKAELDEIF